MNKGGRIDPISGSVSRRKTHVNQRKEGRTGNDAVRSGGEVEANSYSVCEKCEVIESRSHNHT